MNKIKNTDALQGNFKSIFSDKYILSWIKPNQPSCLIIDFQAKTTGNLIVGSVVGYEKTIKELLFEARLEAQRATIQEMIDLSDILESEEETKYEEWRAFKGFRNAMRDKLSQLEPNNKGEHNEI